MNNLFVPYDIALQLKKKGFDEPCLGFYNTDPGLKKPYFSSYKPIEHEWCLPAPLYQQVIDWFREKHNIWIEITMNFYDGVVNYGIVIIGAFPIVPVFINGENAIDYYQGLTKAITEALKLI